MADTLHVARTTFAPVQTRRQSSASALEHSVWLYRFALPLMYVLALYAHAKKHVCNALGVTPRYSCWLVDGLSIGSHHVKKGSARWPALDVTYNFVAGNGATELEKLVDGFWMRNRNAQAVRNRLKIMKSELRAAIYAVRKPGEVVRILSLASGSAQGVIEVIEELRASVRVQALLIDGDPTALAYARGLAVEHGVEDCIETREGDVLHLESHVGDFRPDIVEMLGLVDYLEEDRLAVILFRKIRRRLNKGGFFLTCHIHPNSEMYPLHQFADWKAMRYRTVKELNQILLDGGFHARKIVTEPHRIHSVAVCQTI